MVVESSFDFLYALNRFLVAGTIANFVRLYSTGMAYRVERTNDIKEMKNLPEGSLLLCSLAHGKILVRRQADESHKRTAQYINELIKAHTSSN